MAYIIKLTEPQQDFMDKLTRKTARDEFCAVSKMSGFVEIPGYPIKTHVDLRDIGLIENGLHRMARLTNWENIIGIEKPEPPLPIYNTDEIVLVNGARRIFIAKIATASWEAVHEAWFYDVLWWNPSERTWGTQSEGFTTDRTVESMILKPEYTNERVYIRCLISGLSSGDSIRKLRTGIKLWPDYATCRL